MYCLFIYNVNLKERVTGTNGSAISTECFYDQIEPQNWDITRASVCINSQANKASQSEAK